MATSIPKTRTDTGMTTRTRTATTKDMTMKRTHTGMTTPATITVPMTRTSGSTRRG